MADVQALLLMELLRNLIPLLKRYMHFMYSYKLITVMKSQFVSLSNNAAYIIFLDPKILRLQAYFSWRSSSRALVLNTWFDAYLDRHTCWVYMLIKLNSHSLACQSKYSYVKKIFVLFWVETKNLFAILLHKML